MRGLKLRLKLIVLVMMLPTASLRSQTISTVAVWDFSANDTESAPLISSYTEVFEAALSHATTLRLVERRRFDRLSAKVGAEQSIEGLTRSAPGVLEKAKAMHVDAFVFGDISFDSRGGELRVTATLERLDGQLVRKESVSVPIGKREDPETRRAKMEELAKKIGGESLTSTAPAGNGLPASSTLDKVPHRKLGDLLELGSDVLELRVRVLADKEDSVLDRQVNQLSMSIGLRPYATKEGDINKFFVSQLQDRRELYSFELGFGIRYLEVLRSKIDGSTKSDRPQLESLIQTAHDQVDYRLGFLGLSSFRSTVPGLKKEPAAKLEDDVRDYLGSLRQALDGTGS